MTWTKSRHLLASFLFGCVALGTSSDGPRSAPTWQQPALPLLKNFLQPTDTTLQLAMDHAAARPFAVALSSVPATIDLSVLEGSTSLPISRTNDTIAVEIDDKNRSNEYSLLMLWVQDRCVDANGKLLTTTQICSDPDYMEIVRQPAEWLKRQFGFHREMGYSILGRRNIAPRNDPPHFGEDISFRWTDSEPQAQLIKGAATSRTPEEMGLAFDIVRNLWRTPIRSGPISASYTEFAARSLKEKLHLVRSGEFAIMCSGMRDLFLHAIAQTAVQARAVDAFNHTYAFSDLISYAHSAAEIWVPALDKWVLIDPWAAIYIENEQGVPQSAADLIAASGSADGLRSVAILSQTRRFFVSETGERKVVEISPKQLSLESYDFYGSGHAPGYLTYFQSVTYRRVRLETTH